MYERVLREFWDEGLLKLKHSYKCLWLNRDPYGFFDCDVYKQTISRHDAFDGTVSSEALKLSSQFPKLTTREPMPDERIKARQERLSRGLPRLAKVQTQGLIPNEQQAMPQT